MSVKRVTQSFEPSSKIDLKSEFHLRVSRVGSCGTESVGVNFSQMKNLNSNNNHLVICDKYVHMIRVEADEFGEMK